MVSLLLGLEDHVVHVDFEHVSNFSLEDLVHHALIGSARVLQTEGNYAVVIDTRFHHEGRVFFVCFFHGGLVISRVRIHER